MAQRRQTAQSQTLRARSMALSEVVREAIDERFAALRKSEARQMSGLSSDGYSSNTPILRA
jgi:hypothetical protein